MFNSRIICMSLLWGVGATFLARPWFWKALRTGQLFTDDKNKYGFDKKDWKKDVFIEFLLGLGTFLISLFNYCILGCRQNLYGSLLPILCCLICQYICINTEKVSQGLRLAVIFTAVLLIQDAGLGAFMTTPLEVRYAPPKSDFTLKDEGRQLRSIYPTEKLKAICIAFAGEGRLYGVFAIADKTWLMGTYETDKYLLVDLATNNMTEYTYEELPDFVKTHQGQNIEEV